LVRSGACKEQAVEISDGTSQTANSWAGRADSASNSGL